MTLFSRTTQIFIAAGTLSFALPAMAYHSFHGMVDISIENHSGQTAICTLEDIEGDHIEVQTPTGFVLANGAKAHFKIAWTKASSSHRYHSLGTVKCESTWHDSPAQGTGYHHQFAGFKYNGELYIHHSSSHISKEVLQTTADNTYGVITDDQIKVRQMQEDGGGSLPTYKSWEIHTELTS